MNCGMGITIKDGTPHARLCGGQRLNDENAPTECPKCHRLFPLAKAGEVVQRWTEFSCTRQDEHPREGEHWWEHNGIKVSWTVEPGGVWMAGSQERRT